MNNVNLIVSSSVGETWLDLYEDAPLRLTFNIEEIDTTVPKAEFTQGFRLPATDNNYNFFTTVFEIAGTDFNPGQKYSARINIDGSDFRVGELRLQNVYRNDVDNKVEYECVFIGSTKGLASEVGEKHVGQLDWSDYIQDHNLAQVTSSWDANFFNNNGEFDGNVLFPIIDFGNTYDDAGNTEQTRIAVGHPSSDGGSFDQSNHPLDYKRCRPMVRLQEVMKRMFEQHGFTISGGFLNGGGATKQLYLSAFGNEESVDINSSNSNLAKWAAPVYQYLPNSGLNSINLALAVNDPGDNLVYTAAPVYVSGYSMPFIGAVDYTVNLIFSFEHNESTSNQYVHRIIDPDLTGTVYTRFTLGVGTGTCAGQNSQLLVEEDNGSGYVTIDQICGSQADGFSINQPNAPNVFYYSYTVAKDRSVPFTNVGSLVYAGEWSVVPGGDGGTVVAINGGSFIEVTDIIGQFALNDQWNNKYKCIDLLKDVFKMFRLLMVPNPENPTDFLIVPWSQYIGTGEVKDWSAKLNKDKDIVIRPLLLEQTDRFTLKFASDTDYYNTENEAIQGEVFGTKKLDSVYDVLKGETVIETQLATTPASLIEGFDADWDNFFIPQLHLREAQDDYVQFTPIVPKPRLLYYNGLKALGGSANFYMEDSAGTTVAFSSIPVVSTYTQMPATGPNNRQYVFERETSFQQGENVLNANGQDLYSIYWSKYIELIYNRDARRVTATFSLEATDILNFKYNDVIFVEGIYYYVEKIYNAPLGQAGKVKVDLITLKNYRPSVTAAVPPADQLWEDISDNWEDVGTTWENT